MGEQKPIELGAGIRLPAGFEIVAADGMRLVKNLQGDVISMTDAKNAPVGDIRGEVDAYMRVLLNPETLVYEVESLRLDRAKGAPEVNGTVVRSFRFREMLIWGVSRGVAERASTTFIADLAAGAMTLEEYESAIIIPRPEPLTRDELAARVYVLARAFGLAPLKRVAEVFGVSRSTAIRIMAQARADGLID